MPVLFICAYGCLAGCAAIPPQVRQLHAGASAVELSDTPFFAQERYQCGPAALATLLRASGANVSLQDMIDKVYLPAQRGSLQTELLAATRTSGRLPYRIDGTLNAIATELQSGRPVLVLQNLGVAAIPRWHYAVVVGIDPLRDEIILRSGTDRRRVTATNLFLRTWRRSDYWAMVALRPDELPANVDRARYFQSIAALEQTGQLQSAGLAWQTALEHWPRDKAPLFGLANVRYAESKYAEAQELYRQLLETDGQLHVARNNLAMTLMQQEKYEEALSQIDVALGSAGESGLIAELRDTRAMILQRMAGKL